ncbi:MAG TPA: helix-turn-helix domain-containing protein [Bacteroidales bacterium]|nr:helix-turn-helix domain-containing protein [Bacteroidales bacterium]HRZ49235.1 helix-turn-helix domain-containing protein [Bacteroidales bacterium]
MQTQDLIEQRLQNIETMLLMQKTVFTFDEAAAYTGISKSYLYKLTSTGGIPCYKPSGKMLFFSRVELDQWLMQNRKATSEELEARANTILAVRGGRS